MANHALAALESVLRDRKLDRTFTTLSGAEMGALMPTGLATLDACLRGGLPRGQLSEITGPRSSGRTTLLLQMLAAATCGGEIAALVDTFDRLDVSSAVAAGVDLDRLLWIRGDAISGNSPRCPGVPAGPRVEPLPERTVDRALKALNLVLQAGGFACVALDLADMSPPALKRIPFTTWLRVQRVIEGSDTACVLVTPQPLARSAGGLTLSLTARVRWDGAADRGRYLTGADLTARVVSPRRRIEGDVSLRAAATH
jgi:hypothetical protein